MQDLPQNTQVLSDKVILTDRVLWYDGSVSMTPEKINEYLLSGKSLNENIFVTEITDDIKTFNKLNPTKKIQIKDNIDNFEFDNDWVIPENYKSLDISKFVFTKLNKECDINKFDDAAVMIRVDRISKELKLYEEYNILDLLKTLIYVVDTLEKNKIVWGTGRGSSCSSYILYLIGLHDVDSVEYELDVNEFFR